MDYQSWVLLRILSEINQEQTVAGEGINLLRNTFLSMGGRGAPNVRNDYGFNHQDFAFYQQIASDPVLAGNEMPASLAVRMLRTLSHYRNTQIPNYDEISTKVNTDFTRTRQDQGAAAVTDKVIVYNNSPTQYGKFKVYIPHGVDRSLTIAINRIIDAKFEEEGAEKAEDRYGNMTFPRFRLFQADRNNLHTYWIHPKVLDNVVGLLRNKGFAVEYEQQSTTAPPIPGQTQQPSPTQQSTVKELEVIGFEDSNYGRKIAVKFNVSFEKSKATYDKLKQMGLSPRGIAYQSGPPRFLINASDKESFDKVRDAISDDGIDVSHLDEFVRQHNVFQQSLQSSPGAERLKKIGFEDLGGDKVKVKIPYREFNEEQKLFAKQLIQYTFPEYKWNKDDYSYTIAGNYKQYIILGRLLKKFNYHVDDLRQILTNKLQSGGLQKTNWEGQYDNDEAFMNSIEEKLPESKFDLYDAQKQGVAFLYGREHAILGDATGLGKTLELISAAALRMKDSNKPTLVITLKNTIKQWVDEIINVMGEEERQKISTNPQSPAPWTVVYYENFSHGNEVEANMQALKNAGFGVVILDELHKVKHSTSKRSQNIANVIENIPTRWGASATVSSNKPMDVRNQLLITGHPLGKISEGKFKKDFAGQEAGSRNTDFESQTKAAENLNKWLNLSGVYVRRSKEDIREMPNLSVRDTITPVDHSVFNNHYERKLASYANPRLAVSKLIAARETIAHLKTDQTTQKVINIVQSNKDNPNPAASKVVVFTNFVESARQLVDRLDSALRRINPAYHVITYLSDTKKREREAVKQRFTDDPNAKVLVMSMKMGGTGIDFPNASQHMVVNDFDWTPESAEQSEGRIYRINTQHPVDIDYMVAEGIDKKLFDKVKRKRELASIIQKWRKEFHGAEHNEEALRRIVDAQREMNHIDDDMVNIINSELPGAGEAVRESFLFSDFLNDYEDWRELLFGGDSAFCSGNFQN